jgi:hypothetical protein
MGGNYRGGNRGGGGGNFRVRNFKFHLIFCNLSCLLFRVAVEEVASEEVKLVKLFQNHFLIYHLFQDEEETVTEDAVDSEEVVEAIVTEITATETNGKPMKDSANRKLEFLSLSQMLQDSRELSSQGNTLN